MIYTKVIDINPNRINNDKYLFPDKCEYCGKEFVYNRNYPSSIRKFCSNQCYLKSKRVTLKCKQCGKEFEIPKCPEHKTSTDRRYKHKRRFCSRKCSLEYHGNLNRTAGKESDKWVCQICGGRVSRKEYTRCRACSMKNRKPKGNYWNLCHDN